MSLHACCIDADSSMTEVLTPCASPESMNRGFGQRISSGFCFFLFCRLNVLIITIIFKTSAVQSDTQEKKCILHFFHTCSIHPSSFLLSPLLHPLHPPSCLIVSLLYSPPLIFQPMNWGLALVVGCNLFYVPFFSFSSSSGFLLIH